MTTKGERIKELRKAKNITQSELAKRLNTTKQTISKYEKGIVTNIPSDRIEDMARILDSTPEYILGWEQGGQEERNIKNSDAMADITVRLFEDEDFFYMVNFIKDLDEKQFKRVQVSLHNLFEERFEIKED